MGATFPGESGDYRAARDRLLQQEIALRRQMEAVAAARRALPPGGLVPHDYVFEEGGRNGAAAPVRLSQLFERGKDTLVVYNMMFPRDPSDRRTGAAGRPSAMQIPKVRSCVDIPRFVSTTTVSRSW